MNSCVQTKCVFWDDSNNTCKLEHLVWFMDLTLPNSRHFPKENTFTEPVIPRSKPKYSSLSMHSIQNIDGYTVCSAQGCCH